ncbi:MAG: hypothetical protein ACI4PE_03045 [Bacilli bacterium]
MATLNLSYVLNNGYSGVINTFLEPVTYNTRTINSFFNMERSETQNFLLPLLKAEATLDSITIDLDGINKTDKLQTLNYK